MNAPLFSEYAPDRCTEHGPVCVGSAGGDHIDEPVIATTLHVDELQCGQCGDWLLPEHIEGHLASEGRLVPR